MNTRNTLFTKDNNLFIGKINAIDLAKKFGTPLYIIDQTSMTDVADAFYGVMSEYGQGAITYASKAFCSVATTKILSKHGMWFDAVSGGEVYLLQSAGVDMSKIVFHGNNKTLTEIDEALDAGVGIFAIDSYTEIENLNKIASEKGIVQDVIIRLNPCIEAHTHKAVQTATPTSKFGFLMDNGEAERVIGLIGQKSNLNFKGIHWHIGSQIYDHTSYDQAIEKTIAYMSDMKSKGIKFDIVDLGGGYGVYYTDKDPKFTPKRYSYILKNIVTKVKDECIKAGLDLPFLIVEPGRSIIAEAGVTLYTVGAIKQFENGKKYLAIDGGMFENPRYALYESEYSAINCNKADEVQDEIVSLAGKCCESGDIVAKDIPMQKSEVGDIVAVMSTGAYNYSMSSNYNLNKIPPVVLVDGDKADYIVKPQTYQDLVRNNCTPEWI